MRAAVFQGNGRLAIEDRPEPVITAPDDVIIAVEACGICGTDVQILNVPPGHPATPGTIMGHEFIGHVTAVGSAVSDLRVGQRVTVDADPKWGACPSRAGAPPGRAAAPPEPLACVVNGTNRAAARPGESVVVFGAGPIGCLFTAVLKAAGAPPTVVGEPNSTPA